MGDAGKATGSRLSRRGFLALPVGAGLALGAGASAEAAGNQPPYRLLQLDNGLRAHILERDHGYTSILLTLRSAEIMADDGLAHLMEHTSFVGAAGALTAAEVEEAWKEHVQESNAWTDLGEITWQATFLPEHLPEVLELLAVVSLEQKFDVPTVRQERQVVLEELYADKLGFQQDGEQEFDEALYGRDHPVVRDTLDAEIAKAKQPPERLAAELRIYGKRLRLPGNMDLFVLGEVRGRGGRIEGLVERHFGRFAKRSGPLLEIPPVARTVRYKKVTRRVRELRRPLSELMLGWNTSVTLAHPHAAALTVAASCLNALLFDTVREEHGSSYSPEASFSATPYAGIVHVHLPTTRSPARVERDFFKVVESFKQGVDGRTLRRMRERLELAKRREGRQDEVLLEAMKDRAAYGVAASDFATHAVGAEEVRAAARLYLPDYRGGYVRLARIGRSA